MKVPKIRFKGFGGDWRKRKLGDSVLLNRYKQISAEELQKLNEYHWDIALLPSSKNYDRKCNFYESLSNLINDAEIITVWRARNANTKYYKWKFIASQNHIIESFNNNEVNTKFLYLFILQHDKEFYSTESTYPMFTKQDFNDINLYYPNKQEQEKIWSLFEQLDSHISKNQQKLEKLKNMKQSFLQKLFPKDWSALPELRFKGFEGAWEERKLGEICQITMWQSPDWSTYSNKKSDYILVQWNSDLKNWRVVPRIRTTQKTKTANVGDLIMSVRAPAWAIWKTGYDIVLWRWVASIKGNDFVFYFLVKLDTFWYWKRLSAWSTFDSINSDSIQNLNIYFPSLPEQKKIWAFFEKLDTQITHQSQKIQKLQNIKQSLLEKMFI